MATDWTADSDTITADSDTSVDNPPTGFNVAQYPNVPAMPGVPVLARQQTAAVVAAAASGAGLNAAIAAQLGLPADSVFGSNALYAGLGLQPLDPSYAILDANGNVMITPDSAVELDVSADSAINTHPIELGQFEGYNRVQQQVSVRLLLACQGINMAYTSFLATLKTLRETPQVATLSLPNDSYDNMALKGFSYSRKAERGSITIWADTFWMEERSTNVVVTAPPTTAPQGEPPANLGSLSPAAPTKAQQASISNPPVPPVDLPVTGFIPDLSTIGNGGMPPSGDAF